MNRRTNLYVLSVPAHVGAFDLLKAMVDQADQDPTIERAGSWPEAGNAILMFRAADDSAAIEAAEKMGGNTSGSRLHTGLGVHLRVVAEGI